MDPPELLTDPFSPAAQAWAETVMHETPLKNWTEDHEPVYVSGGTHNLPAQFQDHEGKITFAGQGPDGGRYLFEDVTKHSMVWLDVLRLNFGDPEVIATIQIPKSDYYSFQIRTEVPYEQPKGERFDIRFPVYSDTQ
jgi:hypothetical protein